MKKTVKIMFDAASNSIPVKAVIDFEDQDFELPEGHPAFELPEGGQLGQVLVKTEDGYAWVDPTVELPEGGQLGQVLVKTEDGYAWVDPTVELPEGGQPGQVLVKTEDGYAWVDLVEESMTLEAASATIVLTDEGNNVLQAETTYVDADQESDDFVVDAILESLDAVPVGTTLNIVGIIGEYVVQQPQKIFWLSDILKAHNEALPTRTKLNGHVGGQSVQTFGIEVSQLPSNFLTAITVTVIASNEAGLEGTNNALQAIGEYVILDQVQIAVNLSEQT